jgi:hypothetical protein
MTDANRAQQAEALIAKWLGEVQPKASRANTRKGAAI